MTVNTGSKQAERALPTLFVERFFQFLTVLLLFVALLWEQTHLIYLSLLILIMINGAKLCCRISARGVKVLFEIDRVKVFPGEKISLCGQMQNNSLLPIWLQIEVPLARGFFLSSGIDLLSGDGGLLWREKAAWKWELTAPKRGCYPVGPLSLITGDPLGFFQQKKETQPVSWIIVFPRLVALNPLPLSLEEFFGEQRGENPVEDPVYPVATRAYQTGRPARHIHWKASLRHNCLQEKVFDHTSRKKILLVIDARQFQKDEDEESFELPWKWQQALLFNWALTAAPSGWSLMLRRFWKSLLCCLFQEGRNTCNSFWKHWQPCVWKQKNLLQRYYANPRTSSGEACAFTLPAKAARRSRSRLRY